MKIRKNDILTIPNILSFFRILLVPLLIWMYCVEKNYAGTVVVFTVSAISDIADGIIARKFNMVSDFGKIIDPVADKITQGVLIICLTLEYSFMGVILGLFCFKELVMGIIGALVIKRKNTVNSAKWHGKFNTVFLYFTIVCLIIFHELPANVLDVMMVVCACSMVVSLVMYTAFYVKILRK